MIRISLIVPAYKVEKYIEECLLSCVHQDIASTEYEVIVVDDGSPDKVAEIVLQMCAEHKQIRLIRQENMGLSMARNNGLKEAKGEYVWFIDSDDTIRENCLGELLQRLDQTKSNMLRLGAEFEEEPGRGTVSQDGIKDWRDVMTNSEFETCAQFYLYRRSFLVEKRLTFYPGIYHEDSEFMPRALLQAERVVMMPGTYYILRQNHDSITHTPNPKRAYDILIVCEQIQQLAETRSKADRSYLYYHISGMLNAALRIVCCIDEQEQKRWQMALRKSQTIEALRKSGNIKYMVEWILFCLMPKYIITIYRKLNKI